jgi:hypothetical protein
MYSEVVVCLPVLCLVPCPVFLWGPPGLLAAGACCWVGWGLRSLNAAFPCRSCLSYLIEPVHGRYWKVQVTVHAPYHRLKQNSTFKHEIVKFEFRNIRRSLPLSPASFRSFRRLYFQVVNSGNNLLGDHISKL